MKDSVKLFMQAGYHLQSLPDKTPLNLGNNILLERHRFTNYENLNLSRSIFVTNRECIHSYEKDINQGIPMASSLFLITLLNHIKQSVETLEQ